MLFRSSRRSGSAIASADPASAPCPSSASARRWRRSRVHGPARHAPNVASADWPCAAHAGSSDGPWVDEGVQPCEHSRRAPNCIGLTKMLLSLRPMAEWVGEGDGQRMARDAADVSECCQPTGLRHVTEASRLIGATACARARCCTWPVCIALPSRCAKACQRRAPRGAGTAPPVKAVCPSP